MLFIPFLIFLIFSILLFDVKLSIGGDNIIYMILAKSILEFKKYASLHLVGEPAHIHFPPGFPLILAPFYKIFGMNELYLKVVPFIFSMLSFIILTFIIRDFWIMLSLSTLPLWISYSSKLLSETTFMFFSFLSIYLLIKNKYVLSSLFATFSFFIRNSGIAVIISILIYLIMRKNQKNFFFSLFIFLIPTLIWQYRNFTLKHPMETTYIQEFFYKNPYQPELGKINVFDFLERVFQNFTMYFFEVIPRSIVNIDNDFLIFLISITILIFLILAFIQKIKSLSILEIYFVLFTIITLSWPSVWLSDRFILPIIPILIYYFLLGIKNYLKDTPFKLISLLIFGLNLSYLISKVPQNLEEWNIYRQNPIKLYSPDWQMFFNVCSYIKENVPKDKIIVSRKPEFVYYISSHRGSLYKYSQNPDSVFNSIKNYDYILLDNFYWTGTTRRYLIPAIEKYKDYFEIVYITDEPRTFLLKIKK